MAHARWLAPIALAAALAGCGEDDETAAPPELGRIRLELDRGADGAILATATLTSAGDQPFDAEAPVFEAIPATVGEVATVGAGKFRVAIEPAGAGAMEVEIVASARGKEARATAVVLPIVADGTGQAERVPGLVNTAGTEDSAEISPDGEWLLVSSYSPVDLLCCLLGDALAQCPGPPASSANPVCNQALGPYAAPERPGMPGASRILSPTDIDHTAPALGITEEADFAVPPVSAYGFHRDAEGELVDPFPIALDIDGYTIAPFGMTFVGAPQAGAASLVFAYGTVEGTTDADLFHASTSTFGAPWTLGRVEIGPTGLTTIWDGVAPMALDPVDGPQGNPFFGDGIVWFDDETAAEPDIRFAIAGDGSPSGAFSPSAVAAVSQAGRAETQPHFDPVERRLYFAADFVSIERARLTGDDAGAAGSWEASEPVLGIGAPDLSPGAVIAIGEPSVAHHADGTVWLYFVYYVAREGRFDGSVGRVRLDRGGPP